GPWPALAAGFAVLTAVATLAAASGAIAAELGWNVSWTAGAICATAGLQAAGVGALEKHRRRWRCWSLAALAWLAGQLWWDVYVLTGATVTLRLADLSFWAVATLVIVGLWRETKIHGSKHAVDL